MEELISEINPELELAREYVDHTSVNIFLTGKAGTGKTTFLKEIVRLSPKRKIVVAPTGVAAINAEGMTVHSFFQIPFGVCLPNYNTPEDKKDRAYKLNKTKISIIRSLELLIIDEVSMLRADVMDAIDGVLRKYRHDSRPFGGVQVLMIGDMQQLPPVTRNDEWSILREFYNSPFFFDSKVLSESGYVCIELRKIYRQSDPEFISLLAKVRDNRLDPESLERLNSRYRPSFEPKKEEGYIILSTHNDSARIINDKEMSKLDSPSYRYEAIIEGDFPSSLYPQNPTLILKKGAQVMFTKNDHSPEKRFVNGTLGIVTDINEAYIEVTPLDNTSPIAVERDSWENLRYEINHESKEIVSTISGMFTQYPLRLAWAITIHKSQGLTFAKAIIDAAKSFTHGQVYVALSRCKSMEGLVLSSKIGLWAVMNDKQICDFNCKAASLEPDTTRLAADKQQYFREVLTSLFDFTFIAKQYFFFAKFAKENLASIYPKAVENWEAQKQPFRTEIEEVSEKFIKSLNRLITADYETNAYLRERIAKASEYFLERCAVILAPIIETTSALEVDNKETKKVFKEIMKRLTEALQVKTTLFRYCLEGFELREFLKAKAVAEVEATEGGKRAKAIKSKPPETLAPIDKFIEKDIENSELFNTLRNWRNNLARERDIPPYCIMHQKTLIALCNSRPCDAKELLAIRGIGKKFVEQYGEDVLRMISE